MKYSTYYIIINPHLTDNFLSLLVEVGVGVAGHPGDGDAPGDVLKVLPEVDAADCDVGAAFPRTVLRTRNKRDFMSEI